MSKTLDPDDDTAHEPDALLQETPESVRTPPPGAVHELAERAVEFVRTALEITLDYTPETLPIVDHYLRDVPKERPEMVRLIAHVVGAYYGEVLRRALPAEWEMGSDDPEDWALVLDGVRFSPVGVAAEAITHAPVEDLDAGLLISETVRATVDRALAERPPVDEDEYYSLSGRLETLLTVLDLVANLRPPVE